MVGYSKLMFAFGALLACALLGGCATHIGPRDASFVLAPGLFGPLPPPPPMSRHHHDWQ